MENRSILIFDDSYQNTNLFYKTRFLSSVPFVYLYCNGIGNIISPVATAMCIKKSKIKNIYSYQDFGYPKKVKLLKHKDWAFVMMLKEIMDYFKVKTITIPKNFPVFYASGLSKLGIKIIIDCKLFVKERSIKTDEEILFIRKTQKSLENTMSIVENMIKSSKIKNGFLMYDNSPLTSSKLKKAIELSLLKEDCHILETIIACGKNAANPHYIGENNIMANEPILIDMYPYHKENRYFSDMTRTLIKGGASKHIHKMYEAVLKTQQKVISEIKPGINGSYLYKTACECFREYGFPTLMDQKPYEPMMKYGFIHSIGHGLGLDVHESPQLFNQNIKLEPGNVIAIEPGLYDPEHGGIRIEDIILVTEKGYKNLTNYHKNFLVN